MRLGVRMSSHMPEYEFSSTDRKLTNHIQALHVDYTDFSGQD